jgi:hypothetical protein
MPRVLLLSIDTIWDSTKQQPIPGIVTALKGLFEEHAVVVVSSHPQPAWFPEHFGFAQFQWCTFKDRQSGAVVHKFLDANKERFGHADFIVIGASDADFFMAVNSKTCLLRAEWAPLGDRIRRYGVPLSRPESLPNVLRFLEDAKPWYFRHEDDFLRVYALTNAGTIKETDRDIIRLVTRLRECLKAGNMAYSMGFKLHLFASLSRTPIFRDASIWAHYPSSNSKNSKSEPMWEFAELARETFKCLTNGPLLLRHKPSPKRHTGGGDRNDPTSQLATVHLNPSYRDRIPGSTVIVLDDYLTYGVSFGVSAALLKRAGAQRVACVAMGKFGDTANDYSITIHDDDVFAPLHNYEYTYHGLQGTYEAQAQLEFLKKFKKHL